MASEATEERTVFLSTLPASERDRRSARLVLLVSGALFLAAAPFAQVKLPEIWAFIPSYQSALLVNDLITAVLLFAQFAIVRSPALLVLSAGYLFTALMATPHALSFPRLFAPTGLIGAGPQTTAWLYMIWHGGFPLAVILYVALREMARVRRPAFAIVMTCIAVPIAVCAAALLTTVGHGLLPTIMRADSHTSLLPIVVAIVWLVNLTALLIVWKRQPRSVLDQWLIVVMSAWLFDIALSAMLNAGRFDLGFYAGRVYGLLAASLVLIVLLVETTAAYARMARSFAAESQARDRQLHEVEAELIHVSRLSELGQMVSALAHEVNQPLTAVGSYVRASRRLLRSGDTEKSDEALGKAVEQVTRANEVIQRLRQFVKKTEAQHSAEDVRRTVEEAAAFALLGSEGQTVRFEMQFAPDLPLVVIDKVQIQQVLLNLIRNAVEAMQATTRRDLIIGVNRAGNGMVELSIADTGPGLAPEIRQRLFQPFTTTKATGMGVGLSICRSIIEAHGGHIRVDDRAGGGTEFRFTLPVAGADPSSESLPLAATSHA